MTKLTGQPRAAVRPVYANNVRGRYNIFIRNIVPGTRYKPFRTARAIAVTRNVRVPASSAPHTHCFIIRNQKKNNRKRISKKILKINTVQITLTRDSSGTGVQPEQQRQSQDRRTAEDRRGRGRHCTGNFLFKFFFLRDYFRVREGRGRPDEKNQKKKNNGFDVAARVYNRGQDAGSVGRRQPTSYMSVVGNN